MKNNERDTEHFRVEVLFLLFLIAANVTTGLASHIFYFLAALYSVLVVVMMLNDLVAWLIRRKEKR